AGQHASQKPLHVATAAPIDLAVPNSCVYCVLPCWIERNGVGMTDQRQFRFGATLRFCDRHQIVLRSPRAVEVRIELDLPRVPVEPLQYVIDNRLIAHPRNRWDGHQIAQDLDFRLHWASPHRVFCSSSKFRTISSWSRCRPSRIAHSPPIATSRMAPRSPEKTM